VSSLLRGQTRKAQNPSATDNALQINLTTNSDGGGVLWYKSTDNDRVWLQWVSYGSIYLATSRLQRDDLALGRRDPPRGISRIDD
jgi:hypothetical protein